MGSFNLSTNVVAAYDLTSPISRTPDNHSLSSSSSSSSEMTILKSASTMPGGGRRPSFTMSFLYWRCKLSGWERISKAYAAWMGMQLTVYRSPPSFLIVSAISVHFISLNSFSTLSLASRRRERSSSLMMEKLSFRRLQVHVSIVQFTTSLKVETHS